MKSYFGQYRPFLVFLAKFLLTYIVLSVLYGLYLHSLDTENLEIDGMTSLVSHNVRDLLNIIGLNAEILPHLKEPSYRLFMDGKWLVRIVEGCNAVSVMILFAAFVVAFSGKFIKTLLFIIAGIFIIHILNVARIALLTIGLFHYPQYEDMLHDIVFPLVIYGTVFLLWVIWVKKFSSHAAKA